MGNKNDGYFAKAKDDEPIFVLLGRDPNAPETVRFWAERRKIAIEDGQSNDTQRKVQDAYECADAMAMYQARGTSETYRALARRCGDVPANALSLQGSLNDLIARLLNMPTYPVANYMNDLRAADSVLPRTWALINLITAKDLWRVEAARLNSPVTLVRGHGYSEAAARTCMGLCARAYDLDFPK